MEIKNFYNEWGLKCESCFTTMHSLTAYNFSTNQNIPVTIKSTCPRGCGGCMVEAEIKIKEYLISPAKTIPEIGYPKPNQLEESICATPK